jgi:hypothetical protein
MIDSALGGPDLYYVVACIAMRMEAGGQYV